MITMFCPEQGRSAHVTDAPLSAPVNDPTPKLIRDIKLLSGQVKPDVTNAGCISTCDELIAIAGECSTLLDGMQLLPMKTLKL